MEELEVVLVNQPNTNIHIMQYPYNNIDEIRKHYDSYKIEYGPLSNKMIQIHKAKETTE